MTDRIYNVLFLCTGNSGSSILAEALLNKYGAGRFKAYSAGSSPKGAVHPMALLVLNGLGFDTAAFRSKSWDEFSMRDVLVFDFIFTVCDNAAGEICPIWPGHPMTAHWGIEDPATVEGAEQRDAFMTALRYLQRRIDLFLALPLRSIEKLALQSRLMEIGQQEGATNLTKLT